MSRTIDDLHPECGRLYMQFAAECERQGLDYILTCTHRSIAEQNELYAKGRTEPGRIVTRARGGQSNHNFMLVGRPASLAFDIVPLRHGKPVWGTAGNGLDNDPTDDDADDLELWQRFGEIGKACGLKWYGEPDAPFRELAHFELINAREIREAI